MLGLIIPNCTPEKFLNVLYINADKNYLTPLELAAIADNRLIDLTYEKLVTLLKTLHLTVKTEDEERAVKEAIRLAELARG